MKPHSEEYRAKCAQYLLCKLIEELEEHVGRLDDKYGPLTDAWIAMIRLAEMEEAIDLGYAVQKMPEFLIGTTPQVVRVMRRSQN